MKQLFYGVLICLSMLEASVTAVEGSINIVMNREPSFENPGCQLATAEQFYHPDFAFICSELHQPINFHRKLWEFCYIVQGLRLNGALEEGKSGLGFGVGLEPLPALFAKYGCNILATDQDFKTAVSQGWAQSNQYAHAKTALNSVGICDPALFDKRVQLGCIDMNNIDPIYYGKYDFVWSSCSLEHLGSINAGAQFVINSLKCLKPGGIAIHTTEFNLSSLTSTVESGPTVIYRRYDIIHLIIELILMGYEVKELNLYSGNDPLDHHIDLPPYGCCPHLKLLLEKYISTSVGLIIKKPGAVVENGK